jgi:hypothetical protein
VYWIRISKNLKKKIKIKQCCGIQSWQLWYIFFKPTKFISTQMRLLIKYLLVFKNLQISIDSSIEWIFWDFLVKITHTSLFQQSHSNHQEFFILSMTFLPSYSCSFLLDIQPLLFHSVSIYMLLFVKFNIHGYLSIVLHFSVNWSWLCFE